MCLRRSNALSTLLIFLLGLILVQSQPVSKTSTTPTLMPPHPKWRQQIQSGEVTLPTEIKTLTTKTTEASSQVSTSMAPLTGTIHALALLVEFSDLSHDMGGSPASFFDTLIFEAPKPGRGSVRDYYNEVSYGQVDIITLNFPSALGWQHVSNPIGTYTNSNYCLGSYPNNCQKLAEDIIDVINPLVDFSKYDNNGDGSAESIMLVHAGRGSEYTLNPNDIWSHSWTLNTARNYDGVIINKYVIMPEYWVNPGDMTIGVFAHEMGHGFWNLPDLYDRDGSSSGVGDWSLMGTGSWNGPGNLGASPAWPDAFSRIKMGFSVPTTMTANIAGLNLPAITTSPPPTTSVYKLSSTILKIPQEYFLIENRQQTANSYDQYLPGNGLLIWHVDETMLTSGYQNDRECRFQPHSLCPDRHYLVALEQADGKRDLEAALFSNQGDSGDPFPGSTTNRTYNFSSNPESSSWYSTVNTCISVTNISNSSPAMTADVKINCGPFGPLPPSNLVASAVSTTQVNLTWQDNSSDESDFHIEKSLDGSTGWSEIGIASANATNYPVSDLSCSTLFYFRVRAHRTSDSTYSGYSNTARATNAFCPPLNLSATSYSKSRIDLAWQDTTTGETDFHIERSPNGINTWLEIATVPANNVTYSNNGLISGNTYFYRLRAHRQIDDFYSPYSNIDSAKTMNRFFFLPSVWR